MLEVVRLADSLGEFRLASDGIDLGRDGNVVPWSGTPWSSSIDFRESTTSTVETLSVGGRTFEITARPDPLDRGDGIQYDVNAVDGETPESLDDLAMTEIEDVRRGIRTYVEERYEESTETETDPRQRVLTAGGDSTESRVVDTSTLGYGWALVETREGTFYVTGRTEDGTVYLSTDGEMQDERRAFASKDRARQAFRRWRDENTGDRREEATEARLKRSEKVVEFLRQRSDDEPEVEVETVETETGVTVNTPNGYANLSPVAVAVVVFVVALYLR